MIKTNRTSYSTVLNECLEAMAVVLEYDIKDYPSHQHAVRVGEGCVLIGDKIGLAPDKLQKLYYAGLLHDIGKIAIDMRLLSKKDPLLDEEFEVIKKHAVYGSRIMSALPELKDLSLWIRWHHERWDGSGYPDGLTRDEIPVEVQVLSAIDCLDSLQTPRLDRDRLSPEEAYKVIEQETGTHFNPDIMKLVLEMVGEQTLVPGKSSERFLDLKRKYLESPLLIVADAGQDGYGMAGLYHILRLFARVIDAKHRYTAGHSTRVAILAKYLADRMDLSVEERIMVEIAGLLHDAGKIGIPTEILDKEGMLTGDDWSYIREHPTQSFRILNTISAFSDIAIVAAHHHERLDGSGYPSSLRGDEINRLSQIIAIADTYDAVTSTRTYRKGQTPPQAYEIIRDGLGVKFNREVGTILLETPHRHISALFDMLL